MIDRPTHDVDIKAIPRYRRWQSIAIRLWPVVFVGVVYFCTLCILERRDFWIVDNAGKFLQTQAILNSNFADSALPWPGRAIDPAFEFNPIPVQFSEIRNEKLYSTFPPVFATVSAFLFGLLGVWGLYVLPFVSSLVTLVGVSRLASRMSTDRTVNVWAVLIAGLCTPMWFYSVVFWEHAIAVALCIWALIGLVDYIRVGRVTSLVMGVVLAVLGVYFRDDLYLFCAAIGVMIVFHARGQRLKSAGVAALAMTAAIIPLWIFQWKTLGHPLGFHLGAALASSSGFIEHLLDRPKTFHALFTAFHPSLVVSLVLALPIVGMFVARPRVSTRTFGWLAPLLVVFASAGSMVSLYGYLSGGSPISWMLKTNSLFSTTPVLVLALFRIRENGQTDGKTSPDRFLWGTVLVTAICYGLGAKTFFGADGIHWGNRLLLLLYPLLAVPAGANLVAMWRRAAWFRPVVGFALVVAFAAQTFSINILREKKDFSRQLNEELAKFTEEIVVTNVWWVPQTLHTAFYDKSVFVAPSREQLQRLFKKLDAAGYERCVLVTLPSGVGAGPGAVRLVDERLGFFSLEYMSGTIDVPED